MNALTMADFSFDNAVSSLKAKAADFAVAYNQFLNNEQFAALDPALYSDWKSANNYASAVKATIQYINEQVDSASNWLSGVLGMNGLQSIGRQKGLGFLPLIPIAYVLAATAALTYAYGRIVDSNNAIEQYKIQAGLAQQGVTIPGAPTLTSTLGDTLKWVVIGVAAYFIVPKLIKEFKGKM